MPVLGPTTSPNYPSLETITNLVRALSNDAFAGATGTPGEGQVLTDYVNTNVNNPLLLHPLNSAIRTMYRKVRNIGSPTLIKDNVIYTNVPVINGTQGLAVPDPSVQVRLGFDGFDPGNGVVNTGFTLPSDLLAPLELWERQTNSNDIFTRMEIRLESIQSVLQGSYMRTWEWRNDNIFMPGSVLAVDLRLRYEAVFPTFFTPDLPFSTTFIPVLDCEEAVAFLTLEILAMGLSPQMAAIYRAKAADAIFDLSNEIVRRKQRARIRQRNENRQHDVYMW